MNGQIVPYEKKQALIQKALESQVQEIERSLPDREISADRLVRVALNQILVDKNLLDCTPGSIVKSVMHCAESGLVPDGLLGEAWFIPFKGKCQMIPGYQGLIKLARQSQEIAKIDAHVVYHGESFRYHYGTSPEINHEPNVECEKNPITHVYAVAWLKNGHVQFRVMSFDAVEKIRKAGKAPNSPAWTYHWNWMAIKTVLKQLLKLLPRSTRLQAAIALDDRADVGLDQDPEPVVKDAEVLTPTLPEPQNGEQPSEAAHRVATEPLKEDTRKAIMASYREMNIDDEMRHRHMEQTVQKASTKDLTEQEGQVLLDVLRLAKEEGPEPPAPSGHDIANEELAKVDIGCTCGEAYGTRPKGAWRCEYCREGIRKRREEREAKKKPQSAGGEADHILPHTPAPTDDDLELDDDFEVVET